MRFEIGINLFHDAQKLSSSAESVSMNLSLRFLLRYTLPYDELLDSVYNFVF